MNKWQDENTMTRCWETSKDEGSFENNKVGAENETQVMDNKKRTQEVKLKMQTAD